MLQGLYCTPINSVLIVRYQSFPFKKHKLQRLLNFIEIHVCLYTDLFCCFLFQSATICFLLIWSVFHLLFGQHDCSLVSWLALEAGSHFIVELAWNTHPFSPASCVWIRGLGTLPNYHFFSSFIILRTSLYPMNSNLICYILHYRACLLMNSHLLLHNILFYPDCSG